MNKAILARNLLLLAQADEIGRAFSERQVPVYPLKGIALILLHPAYAFERNMEDIDFLVAPGDRDEACRILSSLGYAPVAFDAHAFAHPGRSASVDIDDDLWYLDGKGNGSFREKAVPLDDHPGLFLPAVADLYLHLLAHAAVHHARREEKWLRDLALLNEVCGARIDRHELEEKLRKYGLMTASRVFLSGQANGWKERLYLRFLEGDEPLKGHLSRFIFLPLRRKPGYLLLTLFPSKEFMRRRYALDGGIRLVVFRLLRPFFLLARLFSLPFKRSQ